MNKGYDDTFLERLKFNNDIVSIIGKYVTLNQKGKTHWGNCPFHSEKTPSFAVNGLEQYYHCFGCGESGDVIKFIEKLESVDFMSAVKILADTAGMEVPEFVGDDNIKEKKQQKEAILKANKDAAIYYNKMLYTDKGKDAYNYLLNRGLNKGIINRFGLGVSFDWVSMVKHLKSKGYTEELLTQAGLIAKGSKGNYYDIMAERIMFPIINTFGQVIGFSARALKDGKYAKYRNTAQTLVFDKSRVVYAINLLKKLKQKQHLQEIILVEGQMDVIAMHKAGFENCVACMGTSLTKYHAKELKRFSDKVIISFDGDSAGQKATLRSLEILQNEKLKVYVISMPDKLDPDDYIKKYGSDSYEKLLKDAQPLNDYKLQSISEDFNLNDNIDKTKYIDKALEEIKRLKSSFEREIYLEQLSKKTKVDIHTLERDLEYKMSTNTSDSNEKTEETKAIKDASFKSSEFVLASIVHKKDYAKMPDENIFKNQTHKKLYDFVLKGQNLQKQLKISHIFDEFDVENTPEIKDIINYHFNTYDSEDEKQKNEERYFNECITKLNLEKLLNEQKNIVEQIENANSAEEKNKLMQKLSEIIKKITNLKRKNL
jgi:DNA primase